jgi:hypothetical protein
MKEILKKSKKYWESDASFITLLAMLLFTVFIMPVLIDQKETSTYFLNVIFILLFGLGMFSTKNRALFIISAVMLVLHVVLRFIRFTDNPYEFYLAERIIIMLNLGVFAIINFRLLFRDYEVGIYRVIGAINVYLLIALIGCFGFEVIQLVTGNSITGDFTFKGLDRDYGIFIYYSFVSITTVGFGDMIPYNMAAKMLSVFLSTFGFLYPAVVIAKLVTRSSVRKDD